jgi:hypothetical protein
VTVTVDGNTYTATNDGYGNWALADDTISPDLDVGLYDVEALATDRYGNTATDATANELAIADILDDGDPGFSVVSGGWASFPAGYEGDLRYAPAGGGSAVVEWAFSISPGSYRVSATWFPSSNRATDSPFTILDGTSPLGTVDVNQELAPDDFTDEGADWEDLGVFTISGNVLAVQLSNNANEYVIADAIRIEPIATLKVTIADTSISENGGNTTGTVTRSTSTSGEITVALTISDSSEATVPATVTILDGQASGTFTVTAVDDPISDGTQTVTITAERAGYTGYGADLEITDDEPLPPAPPAPVIIDDGDAGFSILSGTWGSAPSGFEGDLRYAAPGGGSAVAQWEFTTLTPGIYQVSATWFPNSNRATDSPFTILDGSNPLDTVDVNQKVAPDDFSDAGASWEDLGIYEIGGSKLTVRLSDNANGYVIADAIRVQQVNTLTVTIAPDTMSENGGTSTGTVTRSGDTSAALGVGLESSDLSEATVPDHVIFLAGQDSATFSVAAVDDGVSDGPQTVTVAATAVTYTSVSAALEVTDDEPAPPPPQIIDNGDAGFQIVSGSWGTALAGYQGDLRYAAAGGGGSRAEWTLAVSPGAYRVSATWIANSNRATDAPFSVFDGPTLLAAVDVNQELPPDDLTDAGAFWEDLGAFQISGNSLVVQLTNDANEYVIADAVRVQQLVDTLTVEISADSIAENGGSTTGTVTRGPAAIGDLTVSLASSDTSEVTVPSTVTIPDGQASATFPVSGVDDGVHDGPQTVTVSASADGYGSIGDTVEVTDNEPPPGLQIVDDGDAGFRIVSGSWGTGSSGYQGDLRYAAAGSGSSVAEWEFAVSPGTYRVSATWYPHPNRATDAPFTLIAGSTSLATVDVNQELAPNDLTHGGASWEHLGIYPITESTLLVQLSNAGNEYVIADAIRIERVNALTVTIAADSISENGGTTTGTVTRNGPPCDALTVDLASSEPDEATADPDTVIIPAGQASATFQVNGVDDGVFDGPQTVTITPSAPGYESVSDTVVVTDDELPPAVQIIDNGDAGFRIVSGAWGSGSTGYQGDLRYAAAGNGSSLAEWQFAVTPGVYSVAATWFPNPNRATDAPFTIMDGSNPLGTVDMNQELAPDDFDDAGGSWENLGVFPIGGATLVVRLSNAANEYVIADAIRIERVDAVTVTIAADSINENGGSTTGTVTRSGDMSAELTVDLTSSDPAKAEAVPDSVIIPATQASATFQVMGVNDDVFDGMQTVTITPSASGLTGVGDTVDVIDDDPSPPVQIIDNGDTSYRVVSGTWTGHSAGYQGDLQFSAAGTGAAVVEWAFAVSPDSYRVSATWVPNQNRATDAPFTILDGSSPLGTVDINQDLAPDDRNDAGADWEDLGVYTVNGNNLVVQLSNDSNGYVIADAIRIERVIPPGSGMPSSAAYSEFDAVPAAGTNGVSLILHAMYAEPNFAADLKAIDQILESGLSVSSPTPAKDDPPDLYDLIAAQLDSTQDEDDRDEVDEATDLVLQAEDGWLD